jgi:uncharacterized protein (UPF0548 family)
VIPPAVRDRERGPSALSPDERRALDALHDRAVNFDVARLDEVSPAGGWRVDDYRRTLPAEAPGDPEPGGSWATAVELMKAYAFADPKRIRAVYDPASPLEGRDMLLEGRFLGLRFRFGCRVTGVADETREIGGRPARIWGWSYRTLQGHLEMGQMDYEVRKWLDDGTVEFRVHVVSRAARIPNPLIRLGFRLAGHRLQVGFARRACVRMAGLTAAALRSRPARRPPRATTPGPPRPPSPAGAGGQRR